MQQSMIPGKFTGFLLTGNSVTWEKQCMGNFLTGTGEVQMLQMNQLHNDVVMNMNR